MNTLESRQSGERFSEFRSRSGSVSVAIPVYNEVENLEGLHDRLTKVMAGLEREYEIIYVDDGSTDGSGVRLRELAESDSHVTVCRFVKNFGQTAAISAGIDLASGEIIVLLDADLQNEPADIPRMLERFDEGYDVVSGWRRDRKDKWLTRRLPSMLANALISRISGVKLHDYGCTLKAYRSEILRGFRLYGEMHRFLPAYASQMGGRILEMPVRHHHRTRGKSKYGLERTLKVILDLAVVKFLNSYSNRPIHVFGGAGIGLITGSAAIVMYLVWDKLAVGSSMIESPLLLMAVMLFVLGGQSIFIGLLAELLNRTYHESQDKPTYIIRDLVRNSSLGDGRHDPDGDR